MKRRLTTASGRLARAPGTVALGFLQGLSYPFRGAKFVYIQHRALARIWIFPMLIVVAAIIGVLVGVAHYHGQWVGALVPEPDAQGFWGGLLALLHGAFEMLVAILLAVVGVVAVLLLSNVIAAPFNDALSQAVEGIVTGQPSPPFSLRTVGHDILRTVALELTKLTLWAAVMVPLWLSSLALPVVGQAAYTGFGLGFTALYWSIDYLDWPASRREEAVARRFRRVREHLMPMLGFGMGVWILLFVPGLNLLFMPAAVAGGTLLFLELERCDLKGADGEPASRDESRPVDGVEDESP